MRMPYLIQEIGNILSDDHTIALIDAATGLPIVNPDLADFYYGFSDGFTRLDLNPVTIGDVTGWAQASPYDLVMPVATNDWPLIGGIIFYRNSDPNLITYSYTFARPITVLAGQQLIFPAGSIKMYELDLDRKNI